MPDGKNGWGAHRPESLLCEESRSLGTVAPNILRGDGFRRLIAPMKLASFLHAVALLVCSTMAHAQSDTAHQRAVYTEINAKEKSLKKVTASYLDEPTEFALTGFLDGGEVKKIVVICGDDGAGVTEYYPEGEKPLFVFNTYSTGAEGGEKQAQGRGAPLFQKRQRLQVAHVPETRPGIPRRGLSGCHGALHDELRGLRGRVEEG
jgi:hypothetical protein